jgi:hypothetical protein
MKDDLPKSFGLLIAYLLPGVVGLWALSYFAPFIREWFGAAARTKPEGGIEGATSSVGGFLFVALGSIGVGLFVQAIRWLAYEKLLLVSTTRWRRDYPNLNHAARKTETEAAYAALIDNHYRYYQFYSNTSVTLPLLYGVWCFKSHPPIHSLIGWGAAVILAELVLIETGIGALDLFFNKAEMLLGTRPPKRLEGHMSNGEPVPMPEEDEPDHPRPLPDEPPSPEPPRPAKRRTEDAEDV